MQKRISQRTQNHVIRTTHVIRGAELQTHTHKKKCNLQRAALSSK